MSLVDVSHVSFRLFVTGAVLILLIGGFLSLGVLRLFQGSRRQGIGYLAASAVSFVVMVWIMNRWFA